MPQLCSIVAHYAPYKLGRLTALLEYMTVLLEYLDLLISLEEHSKDLEGPAPPLAMPLKKRHGVRRLHRVQRFASL